MRSSPSSWCRTSLTTAGIFWDTSFLSFVRFGILAAVFGWSTIGPFVSTWWPQLTDRSCMNAQLFNFHAAGASVCSPSSNDSSDWEPTGSSGSIVVCKSWNRGVALRLSPSAATRTAAPSVLVRIVQQLVQLCGLRILGRTEKGMLRPLQLRVPPRKASLAVLRVFSLFR